MLKKIKDSADFIRKYLDEEYETAIILGSGLGALADSMEVHHRLPYKKIPFFPVSTVEGHSGNLIIGKFGGRNVIAMQGRFHYYEGYSMKEVTFPIRVMKLLGVKHLFVSNAAGGVNPTFRAGDLMVITDHINLFPEHPLRGKNMDEFGARFPSMTEAYSKRFIRLSETCADALDINIKIGVFVGLQGPSFETPAEYKWLRIIGGDAVAMSTVPEVIVARHCGMECFGMSVITNATASPEEITTSHSEVQDVSNSSQPAMTALFREIISRM